MNITMRAPSSRSPTSASTKSSRCPSTESGSGVANGYYDLATPFFATEYTFDHLGLEPQLQGNVTLAKLEADVAGFIAKVAP